MAHEFQDSVPKLFRFLFQMSNNPFGGPTLTTLLQMEIPTTNHSKRNRASDKQNFDQKVAVRQLLNVSWQVAQCHAVCFPVYIGKADHPFYPPHDPGDATVRSGLASFRPQKTHRSRTFPPQNVGLGWFTFENKQSKQIKPTRFRVYIREHAVKPNQADKVQRIDAYYQHVFNFNRHSIAEEEVKVIRVARAFKQERKKIEVAIVPNTQTMDCFNNVVKPVLIHNHAFRGVAGTAPQRTSGDQATELAEPIQFRAAFLTLHLSLKIQCEEFISERNVDIEELQILVSQWGYEILAHKDGHTANTNPQRKMISSVKMAD